LRWSASMRISRTTSRERTRDSEPGRTARPEPTSSERWDDGGPLRRDRRSNAGGR
jgi:hypothetical protein